MKEMRTNLNKILVVVLTHDRPNTLYRCINTSIREGTKLARAHWLVLDDSNEAYSKQNLRILRKFARKGLKLTHVPKQIQEKITKAVSVLDTRHDVTFLKENDRDISGLRNLGLLVSIITDSDLTFFIDDDIVVHAEKDHTSTFFTNIISRNSKNNFIIGANLGGILDESYVGRLLYLISVGKIGLLKHDKGVMNTATRWNFQNSPLWKNVNFNQRHRKKTTHTSGGLMSFKLTAKTTVPFPQGYNEDWIWCLLQASLCKTKIFKDMSWGIHAPPKIFMPNQKTMLWEGLGEIIFSSILAALQKGNVSNVRKVWKLTKENSTFQNDIEEYKYLENSLSSLVKKSTNSQERKKLTVYLSQIKKTRLDLKNTDISSIIDKWFSDFILRRSFFSSILKRKDICNRISNVLRESEVQVVG